MDLTATAILLYEDMIKAFADAIFEESLTGNALS
jgi:hypothetical protein